MRRFITAGRWLDVVAIAVIAFLAYRFFVVPRYLSESSAYPAPRVTYATLAGTPFVLSRQRGRVVFLDFWASWCEPCKLSLPIAEKFAAQHPGVEVVPVNVGEPAIVVRDYARAHRLRNVALDPKALSRGFFQIQGFPTMVVIDRRGRVRATWPGFNPALGVNMAHAAKTLAT